MFQPDFFYSDQGEKIPLPPAGDSLAIAYKTEVPPKDLEALIRGDDALAGFARSSLVARHRIVVYKRSPGARGSLEGFAERLLRSDQVSYITLVALLGESPVVVTDEFLAAFKPEVSPEAIAELNARHGVEPVERPDLYLGPGERLLKVKVPGPGGALPLANRYFETGLVRFAEPDFVHLIGLTFPFTPNDPLFSQQWHLPRIRVQEAWDITRGDPAVVVAVLDSGIEIAHEDFASPGKFFLTKDFFVEDDDPSPEADEDTHGTAVTGLVGADGNNGRGVSGVAPGCRLMPIRISAGRPVFIDNATQLSINVSGLRFAVDRGADVLSNSWRAAMRLPSSLRSVLDHAVNNGRGGRGCVVVFGAANDNDRVATRQAPGTHPHVIVAGACHDGDRRSAYSNIGPEVSVVAPSDGTSSDRPLWQSFLGAAFVEDGSVRKIVTTDRTGATAGRNAPDANPPRTDPAGISTNYSSMFGGTSAACPQVSGVAALVLSVNPNLTHRQVRFLLEATADKIDAGNTDPVGRYQPNGHSQFYGFGRVNAFEAVKAARASVPQDATERVFVRLRRTSGDRFVSTQVLHAVDARRRPPSTAGDLFLRTGPDGFLQAKLDSVLGPLIEEAEVDE